MKRKWWTPWSTQKSLQKLQLFYMGLPLCMFQRPPNASFLSTCSLTDWQDWRIVNRTYFVQNFIPVVEMVSKIQSDPSPLGYGRFSNCRRKYVIRVYVEKYLMLWTLSCCSVDEMNSIDPSLLGYYGIFFFKKGLADFENDLIFRVLFYIITHLHIGPPTPSRPSVRRQSFGHWNLFFWTRPRFWAGYLPTGRHGG